VPNLLGKLLRGVRADQRRSRLSSIGFAAGGGIRVSSPAFTDGGTIPTKHAGKGVGDNISPALNWTGAPANTEQLVVAIEDVDVPLPRPLLHTIALIEPNIHRLAEGALRAGTAGLRFARTSLGSGYAGPRSIPGHGPHHYKFHVLALDEPVPDTATTARGVLAAIDGHVIATGTLTGTYQR
jgi:phosphatidylethanolamine-binding protein (PEBP) family uncharacterized protein